MEKIGRAQSELQSHSDRVCRLLLEKSDSGAGVNRPAVLYRHRFAVGDLAGEKSASGENYSSTA